MAELTAFCYQARTSFLHQLDVRFKLLFLIMISISTLYAQRAGLLILSLFLCLVIFSIHLSIRAIFKELRYFLGLLFFVFLARAFTTPGTPLVDLGIISISRQGVVEGGMVCWRFLAVVLAGLMLVATTRASQIKAAVQWVFAPFPFIPAPRIATMMSLVIRFIPVILNQARETLDAQRARGVENRKNPVYRLSKLAVPLMRRTFESADQLASAMEARCYSEVRTDPGLKTTPKDWGVLGGMVVLCFLIANMQWLFKFS